MAAVRFKEEGNAKLKAGDREAALECYAQGITAAEAEMTAFEGSLEAFGPLKKLLSQLHSNKAHVLMLVDRMEEAVEACRQAVSIDMHNGKAYWRGATAALKLGQNEDAAELVRQGLRDAYADEGGPAIVELLGKSVKAWEEAAAEGGVAAQYNLGLAYLKGNGVARNLARGTEHMTTAAEQGDELAQQMLEQMEAERLGKLMDAKKDTIDVWARAAASGDAGAQFNLGLAYLKGEGVPRDTEKCIELWRMAAMQGDEMAQQNLSALMAEQQQRSA